MKWIAEDGGLCLYFELTGEQLNKIESDSNWFKDQVFYVECDKSSGDNAHIIKLIHNGDVRRILRHLKELKKKYKTVTWWDRDLAKFKRS